MLVDISAHGLGHLAQTVPVVAALGRQVPGLELVVRSGLNEVALKRALPGRSEFHRSDDGLGMAMVSPFRVDREQSLAMYQRVHRDFPDRVDALAGWMRQQRFDAVISNVSYIALAAGRSAGLPTFAFSSLNWVDVLHHYLTPDQRGLADSRRILGEMEDSYRSARQFFLLQPGMPMPRFRTTTVNGVVARRGRDRRPELLDQLGTTRQGHLVLYAFGGMLPDAPPTLENASDDTIILGPSAWADHGWCIDVDRLGVPFEDVLASVDLVISKAGYGIVSELGVTGTASVLVKRNDWPEETHLVTWLSQHAPCELMDNDQPIQGLGDRIERNHRLVKPAKARADGHIEIAERILQALGVPRKWSAV